ncbi:hypothetical protein V1279_005671 [Bradyrhizobium sp. AZCC 1610]
MPGHLRRDPHRQIGLDAREGRGWNYKPSLLHYGCG